LFGGGGGGGEIDVVGWSGGIVQAHVVSSLAGECWRMHGSCAQLSFFNKGLQNPVSTFRDVYSQILQTTAGLEIQQTKVKTRSID
jgi:hypothetical protein